MIEPFCLAAFWAPMDSRPAFVMGFDVPATQMQHVTQKRKFLILSAISDLDEDIRSIKQFDVDMIVNATVRCLDIISPGLNLPHSMPPNMASKYKVGQEIAQACLDLGYRGDIGYQTFLYSGEGDIRKILMFLVERLPKEEEKPQRELSASESLLNRIKCKVKDELSRPWLPPDLRDDSSHKFEAVTDTSLMPAQAWRRFWQDDLFSGAVDANHLLPTLVTLHSRGVLSKYEPYWFVSKKPTASKEESSPSVPVKRKPALPPKPKIKTEADEAVSEDPERILEEKMALELEELEAKLSQIKFNKVQLEEENVLDKKEFDTERSKNVMRAKVVELLPGGEASIERVEAAIEARKNKLVSLGKQWDAHRIPLEDQYRECMEANASREDESVQKAATIRSLVKKRQEMEGELKEKEQLLQNLLVESERLGQEAHRSAYTRRILEIIGNIDKQKLDIGKVLKDTQDVQKEINTLTGQLDRCFALADETIFADAMKNETSKKAYKLLATLHTDCGEIVEMIRASGTAQRQIQDVEEQVENERGKDIAGHLSRIAADLAQMQEESATMAAQLGLKSVHHQSTSDYS